MNTSTQDSAGFQTPHLKGSGEMGTLAGSASWSRALAAEWEINGKSLRTFLYGVLGLYSLGCLLSLLRSAPLDPWPTVVSPLAWLGGFLVTTEVFRGENTPLRAVFQMMVPFSQAQKFGSKLLLTLLFYPLAFCFGVMVLGNLSQGILSLRGVEVGNWILPAVTEQGFWGSIGAFVFGHACAFCGATFFRQRVALQILLRLVAYLAFVAVIFGFAVQIFGDRFGTWFELQVRFLKFALGSSQSVSLSQTQILLGVAWLVGVLTLYAAAWFRFREIEVR